MHVSSRLPLVVVFVSLLIISVVSSSLAQQPQQEPSSSTSSPAHHVVGKDFGPVPESTCTSFQNAFWCPVTFICTVSINDSAAASSHCQQRCPGNTVCTDFSTCRTCASNERNCGDCMFAGGVWSVKSQQCVPTAAECDLFNDTCVSEDSQCEMCDRFNRPVTCLALFPVAVAVLVVALICASVGSVWAVYHWSQPVEVEDQSAVTRLPPAALRLSAREGGRGASFRTSAANVGGNNLSPNVSQRSQNPTGNLLLSGTASFNVNGSHTNSPRVSAGGEYLINNQQNQNQSPRRSGTSAKTKWGNLKTAVILARPGSPTTGSSARTANNAVVSVSGIRRSVSPGTAVIINSSNNNGNLLQQPQPLQQVVMMRRNSGNLSGTSTLQSPSKTPRGSVMLVKSNSKSTFVPGTSSSSTPPVLTKSQSPQKRNTAQRNDDDDRAPEAADADQQVVLKAHTSSTTAQDFLQKQRGGMGGEAAAESKQ